ncbi:MAG: hypothetical protein K9L85_03025 [Candidatus Peribacteraceae bacterium]|nr:hypothetical protein [Candidatus Peribacteraceae bacterium]
MDESPQSSLEKKLDEVLEVLRKIERQNHKNPWASGAKFFILNFTKILASILILIFLWKIWGVVNSISGGFDILLEKISSLKFW